MSSATVPSRRLPRLTRRNQQTGWIGVDIGSSAIKIAQAVKEGGRWKLRLSRLLPIAGHLQPGTDSLPDMELSALIRSALTGRGPRRQSTAASTLPMSVVDLRSLELPPGTDTELRQMIGTELNPEEDPQRSCEFDFWEQPGEDGQKETRQYSVLSLPTRAATGLADTLWNAGLQCNVIDTLPCALARAVTMVERPMSGQTVAALDWGYRTPLFVLIRNGRPVFARTLKNCGGELVVEQVRKQLNVPAGDVHELLLTRARTPGPQPGLTGLSELLTSCAVAAQKRMSEELERTLGYLRSQPGGLDPQRIWMFGCGALLPGIAEQLTTTCGLEVVAWHLGAASRDPLQPAGDAMHALLGPAIGLSALGGTV
ncbi:Competence protein A [Maioricimonas rarisocia]|uniref:Competence protein A n=1 Tax=Maioricimonas rarisocia TaxID=2528026 RepID=A0A517ZCH2_9PLAN|nr:pilus assembly protein PilM [Maioricimonas rarisocia]QDU40140.1 Competence protein A [Maioricimonas rarisocia]